MTQPNNIEFFDLLTLALFDRLYTSFPTPINLDAGAIASEIVASEGNDEAWYQRVSAASHAVNFLAEEGFVTYKAQLLDAGQFAQVRLSAKGLAALNATPESLDKSEPMIGRVRKALVGGAKEAGNESVRQVVQHLLTAGLVAAPAIIARMGS